MKSGGTESEKVAEANRRKIRLTNTFCQETAFVFLASLFHLSCHFFRRHLRVDCNGFTLEIFAFATRREHEVDEDRGNDEDQENQCYKHWEAIFADEDDAGAT